MVLSTQAVIRGFAFLSMRHQIGLAHEPSHARVAVLRQRFNAMKARSTSDTLARASVEIAARPGSSTALIRRLINPSDFSQDAAALESDMTGAVGVMGQLQPPPRALVCVGDPAQEIRFAEALQDAIFEPDILPCEEEAYAAIQAQSRKLAITDSLQLITQLRPLRFKEYLHILFVGGEAGEAAAFKAGADDCVSLKSSSEALVARLRNVRRMCDLEAALHGALAQNQKLSTTDELTGLANRYFFTKHLPRVLARAVRKKLPLSIAMCDIDHFKRINDTFGHATGDDVLRQFGVRLKQNLRRGKDWVARLGGEEFAIVLAGISAPQAINIIEGIRRSIRSLPFEGPNKKIDVTASFGVCFLDRAASTSTCDHLLSAADKALYKSKRHGRDCVTAARVGEQLTQ
jgi:diguanylate cyclase (GGDEF)-like protein